MSVQFYQSRKTHHYHWRVTNAKRAVLSRSRGYASQAACAKGLLLASKQLVRYMLTLKAKG